MAQAEGGGDRKQKLAGCSWEQEFHTDVEHSIMCCLCCSSSPLCPTNPSVKFAGGTTLCQWSCGMEGNGAVCDTR